MRPLTSPTFSVTIPSGSFQQNHNGRFTFQGVINGLNLQVQITPLGNNIFTFKAEKFKNREFRPAKELVSNWLRELHVREDAAGMSIEQWATAENLGINGFQYDKAASFYPEVFKRRFHEDPERVKGIPC
jgi:hypothetical protein